MLCKYISLKNNKLQCSYKYVDTAVIEMKIKLAKNADFKYL